LRSRLRARRSAAAVRDLGHSPAERPLAPRRRTVGRDRKRIAEFAVKHRLPTATNTAAYITQGPPAGYGPNVPDQYPRAAIPIDRVHRGAQPAELPVEQPTTLDLVVNGRVAKALGLTLPQPILLRAVDVAE
jgi:putative ABC transport system substrate-binding protein